MGQHANECTTSKKNIYACADLEKILCGEKGHRGYFVCRAEVSNILFWEIYHNYVISVFGPLPFRSTYDTFV